MRIVGIDFRDGILFVPEVLLAANAMKGGMEILRPLLAETGVPPIGKIVIGTVKGDIHDIGKNLVSMMLEGAGFEVIDLGINNPVEKYLAAALAEKAAAGSKTLDAIAHERGLNAKYLRMLSAMLSANEPSLLLDGLRARWRKAKPEEARELAAEVAKWQKALWKFNTVGHIGKLGGPKAWMEPVNPLIAKQEVRLKLPASPEGKEVVLYLVASDAGDGNRKEFGDGGQGADTAINGIDNTST